MINNFDLLSPKEIEVCEEFIKSKGVTNCTSLIAKKMFIEKSTIKAHMNSIYQKLLVGSQSELMYVLLTNIAQLANCKKDYWSYYKNTRKRKEDNNEKID